MSTGHFPGGQFNAKWNFGEVIWKILSLKVIDQQTFKFAKNVNSAILDCCFTYNKQQKCRDTKNKTATSFLAMQLCFCCDAFYVTVWENLNNEIIN